MPAVRLTADQLRALSASVFEALGAPPETAEIVAAALVDANLAGHDSHGVIRIPEYTAAIRAGTLRPDARPKIVRERGAALLVSGEWGFGQMTGRAAIGAAVRRAGDVGAAVVGLVRCNHLGRVGALAEQAAADGCVAAGWVGGIGGPQQAVPYGGRRPAFGTNPMAAAFPVDGDGPVLLDFATTAVAGGKIMVAHAAGLPAPPDTIVDRDGRPTTNPADFLQGGALLPFGGHKGYALAVFAELLGQLLTGADGTGGEGLGGDAFRRSGAVFFIVPADVFRPASEVLAGARGLVDRLRATPPAPGVERVLTPGEPEIRARRERIRNGIEISVDTWQAIREVATSCGIPA